MLITLAHKNLIGGFGFQVVKKEVMYIQDILLS